MLELLQAIDEAHKACVKAEQAWRDRESKTNDKVPWLVLLDAWRDTEKEKAKILQELSDCMSEREQILHI